MLSRKVIKGFVLTLGCLFIHMLIISNAIMANGGPHEGIFTTTTTSCAGCHRAHSGQAADLLKSTTQYALCTSCHDGSGASTKVTTGEYLGFTQGIQNAGLRGGGFEQALMNTAVSGTFNVTGDPVAITSKHSIGASGATAWGSGTSGNGEAVSLQCGNCHNPHGNANYRMLRGRPTSLAGYSSLTAVNITAGLSDNYTITYNTSQYRDLTQYSSGIAGNMAEWCSQCHTRYKAGAGAGSANSGSAPFMFVHPTNKLDTSCAPCHGDMHGPPPPRGNCENICHNRPHPHGTVVSGTGVAPHMEGECLTCHVAHGSSAMMTGYTATVNWPDSSPVEPWQTGTENQHSRLLTVDNRGVCLQCHENAFLTRN